MPIYAVFSPRFVGGVTVAGTGVRSKLEAIAFPGSVPAGSGPSYLPSRFILVEMQPHAVSPALRQRSSQGVHGREGVRWDFTKNSDFTVNISLPKDPAGVTVHGIVVERDPGIVRLSPGTHPVERFVLRYLRMTRTGMVSTVPDVTETLLTELGAKAQRPAPSQTSKTSAAGRMPAHGDMMVLLQDGSVRWL